MAASPDLWSLETFAQSAFESGQAQPVILASAATGIVDHINSLRGDIDSIFGRAGIAPAMAGVPTLQIKLSSFCRLFEEAAHQTKDENFGLWFGNQFQPHDLGLWGYVGVFSPTLGAALENWVRLFRYHQENSLLRLCARDDGMMMLEYQILAPGIVERRQDAELSLGMFLNIFRECLGRDWSPEEVYLEHPRSEYIKAHEAAFGAPIYFSQPINALVFRPEVLSTAMPRRDLKLMTTMSICLEQIGGRREGFASIVDRARMFVRTRLAEGCPSLEEVSVVLRLSPANIQRELSEAGLTFKELVQVTRRELAYTYLRQKHLPLSEIALLLGYSELSAFSRAVRRWTGKSPKALRRQLLSM
ncbi:MAG: AraC family transcriptional regulator [Kiloniellales bacterium]|nr:AraC family transcriptional regulator [Kiloniellales bacterium]